MSFSIGDQVTCPTGTACGIEMTGDEYYDHIGVVTALPSEGRDWDAFVSWKVTGSDRTVGLYHYRSELALVEPEEIAAARTPNALPFRDAARLLARMLQHPAFVENLVTENEVVAAGRGFTHALREVFISEAYLTAQEVADALESYDALIDPERVELVKTVERLERELVEARAKLAG